ncbi:MAG: alpha/beta hydrolase [Bacteroidota bacterium]
MLFLYALGLALFAFLVSVTIILLLVGPTLLLHPRRRRADYYRNLGLAVTPAELHLPYEEINIIVDGNLKLNTWLIKAEKPKGTIIYLHGVGDCKIDGLRFANLMHNQDYNVFLYDARRHGLSDGAFCTYGYFEKDDVRTIIDYLMSRRDITPGKIGLFGTSMGAAVAIQAAAVDKRIAAVTAENSFATLRTIFDDYQKRMIKLPFHYLRNIVIKRSEMKANFKARDVSPLRAVTNVHVPILIIYGKDDHLINYQYSLRLYDYANQPKDVFPIENARHNDTWKIAGIAYENKLIDFFERNLS